ncbi:MAG: hypothetical protein EOP42_24150, partial [Sphingobacteriaceae bacterium]
MFLPRFFYRLKIVIATVCLSFLTQFGFAQQQKFEVLINRIDSLMAAGLPKSALAEVEKLDVLSRKKHNAPQQIRAAVYRMNLQTYLEENALVAIINRLKLDIKQADYPAKPVLQSVLAEIFWKYYQQNRYQFSQRTALEKPDADFTRWDLKTIIREVGNLYRQSLQNLQREQNTSVAVLEGVLEGDQSTRYLRPTLYDLLLHRALDFYLSEEPDLPKPRLTFSLNDPRLFGADAVFTNLKLPVTDTVSVTYQGLKLLQQATDFHLQKQHPEALADLDLKRLEFLYRKLTFSQKDSLYADALQKVNQQFQNKPIAADALVLLAQFHQQKDSLVLAVADLQKTIKSYPESFGAKNAMLLLQQLNQQSLSAEIENVNVPDEPILAKLNYKNLQKANAQIYQLYDKDLQELRNLQNQNYRYQEITLNTDVLAYIKKLKPVQQHQIRLPDVKDYRQHAAEIKLNPLKTGFYVLLLSDENLHDNALLGLTAFRVTNLAYVSRPSTDGNNEIRTVNRKTGKILPNVNVEFYNYQQDKVGISGKTDAAGKFIFNTVKNIGVNVNLSVNGDFYSSYNYFSNSTYNSYSPEREQTILFTDRQLYRPGQTIYFKGLQISTQNNHSKIIQNEEVEVALNDENNKKIGAVKVKSNAFGTFSGSFILPQAMLNGNVYLRTADGVLNVKVEEYKRPTFQINFDAVKEAYRPGDSIKLKGKVLAFAGYGLADALIKFDVNLSHVEISKQPNSNRIKSINITKKSIDFLNDTITTNAKGEFMIRFKAYSDPRLELASFYHIQAEATNASGETHTNYVEVNVATNPLQINLTFPQKLLPQNSLKFNASINNFNNQLQKGNLQVKVFSLIRPEANISKKRLWEKPDQFLWTREEFKKLFPDYGWKNEDEPKSWTKNQLVFQTDLKTDTLQPANLDLSALKQQLSGYYRIEIAGKNSMGDTVSTVQVTQLINLKNAPVKMEDWAVPLTTKAPPGGKVAVYLIPGIHVLVEVTDGKKMISSEWIYTGKEEIRKEISVPINAGNNFRLQFLTVKDNRVYTMFQPVQIIRNQNPLTVKLLTSRNILQPGEKEQWQLQVSGNE